MKYRYYIVATVYGDVFGTDDTELAEDYSLSDENYVIDTETAEHICMGTVGQRFDIKPAKDNSGKG